MPMSAHSVDDLTLARDAFAKWRAGRPGPGRLPEHLWALAVSVAAHHSPQLVARELGLNAGRLRARLQRRDASLPKGRLPKPTFVELRGADLPAPAPATPAHPDPVAADDAHLVRLTLERPDGTSLTLALAPDDPARAERLMAAFIAAIA
jgi:hypothetical protein